MAGRGHYVDDATVSDNRVVYLSVGVGNKLPSTRTATGAPGHGGGSYARSR